jgi:hypothetical protein
MLSGRNLRMIYRQYRTPPSVAFLAAVQIQPLERVFWVSDTAGILRQERHALVDRQPPSA